MIPINELRVGNWIIEDETIDEQDYNFKQVSVHDFYYIQNSDRYLPIPLTPEILEKAGFNWCDSKWTEKREANKQKLSIQISNLETLDYEEGEFHICGVSNHDVVTFWYEIKYLHQLQNLFFALTGEELKITTPS